MSERNRYQEMKYVMMNNYTDLINIIAVSNNEIELLQELSINCFIQSFGDVNTVENIAQYLAHSFSSPKLLTELETEGSLFYFINYANESIGYYKTNSGMAQTESFDANYIELERIYILKKYQGGKIGQFVLDDMINAAHKKGFRFLWLGVWERNPGAIRFYKKNGFNEMGSHEFMLGNDRQIDILMKKTLVE